MKTLDWILLGGFIVFFFLVVYLVFSLKSESAQCINDPLKYGLSKINGAFSCSCFGIGGKTFSFSKEADNSVSMLPGTNLTIPLT